MALQSPVFVHATVYLGKGRTFYYEHVKPQSKLKRCKHHRHDLNFEEKNIIIIVAFQRITTYIQLYQCSHRVTAEIPHCT